MDKRFKYMDLKKIREDNLINQQELVAKTGLTRQALWNIENGNPTRKSNFEKIENAIKEILKERGEIDE